MTDTTVLIRIVDDDDEFAASQKMLIETLGWEVITYASAPEFLSEDALERPGCLLLDVRMPAMTGLELQQELEKRNCQLPIIFLSAHGDIEMAVHTMRHGAVDFLEKPVEPQRLLARVTKAVALFRIYNLCTLVCTLLDDSSSMENAELYNERLSKMASRFLFVHQENGLLRL